MDNTSRKNFLRWMITKDFWSPLLGYLRDYGIIAVIFAFGAMLMLPSAGVVSAQTSAIDVAGMDIDGASIAATAINIVNAFTPVLILVGGFGLGLYVVGRVIGMLR